MTLTVKDIMHDVMKVDHHKTVAHAAKLMDRERRGSVLVEEDGEVIGILTERDILRKVVAYGLDPTTTYVHQVMSSRLITIEKDGEIGEASALMSRSNIRRLIVVDGGDIVGIITTRSIAKSVQMFPKG